MDRLCALTLAMLVAAQPVAALAQAAAKQDVPPPYGPRLYATPAEEAEAMRAAALRAEEKQAAARRQAEPGKRLAPRRPTRQHVIEMPPSAYSTSGYRQMPVPIPGPGVTPIVPSRPVPVDCIGNACISADGVLVPPPIGSTTITPAGRTCTQIGNFLQCY